jgi:hypothetical protein
MGYLQDKTSTLLENNNMMKEESVLVGGAMKMRIGRKSSRLTLFIHDQRGKHIPAHRQ